MTKGERHTLQSDTCCHISEKGKWVTDPHPKYGAPKHGEIFHSKVRRTWSDVRYYYANIIDYGRIVMTFIALYLMFDPNTTRDPSDWKNIVIAVMIMGSVLLDWVDGPVARYMGQSSVMGCGWDWLADILAQYCLAIWCMTMSESRPFKLFTVLFTAVEISTGLFDFATSCQGYYPTQNDTSNGPWFCIVEHWLTPNQTYSDLGTFCWLVNTIFPLCVCMQANERVIQFLAPFAFLYAWHEVCQFMFIIANWKETFTTLHRQAIDYVRTCKESEKDVLKESYALIKKELEVVKGETPRLMWVNLFNNGKPCPYWDDKPAEVKKRMSDLVDALLAENYHGKPPLPLSFGFINNPVNCNKDQTWHLDYGEQVSNLFISMTKVTELNATQYVRGPVKMNMPVSNDMPAPTELMDAEGVDHLEVSQLVCKPFTLFKLYPGVVHRGIANKDNYDRIVFFLSTNPVDLDIEEKQEKEYGT